jgi:hypothetical protein
MTAVGFAGDGDALASRRHEHPGAKNLVLTQRFQGGCRQSDDCDSFTQSIEDFDGIAFGAVGRNVMRDGLDEVTAAESVWGGAGDRQGCSEARGATKSGRELPQSKTLRVFGSGGRHKAAQLNGA